MDNSDSESRLSRDERTAPKKNTSKRLGRLLSLLAYEHEKLLAERRRLREENSFLARKAKRRRPSVTSVTEDEPMSRASSASHVTAASRTGIADIEMARAMSARQVSGGGIYRAESEPVGAFNCLLDKTDRDNRQKEFEKCSKNTKDKRDVDTFLSVVSALPGTARTPEEEDEDFCSTPRRKKTESHDLFDVEDAREFLIRPCWDFCGRISQHGYHSSASGTSFLTRYDTTHFEEDEELMETQYEGPLIAIISPPGSPLRAAWELLGACLILYDLIYIPLGLFDPPLSWFTQFMDWFILSYWTLNMITCFFQGYIYQGLTVMNPSKIARHYLTTWFIVDVLVVVPDWVLTLYTLSRDGSFEGAEAGKSLKALRMVRLTRTVRLVRLLKLGSTIQAINDRLTSESASIIANMIQMITALLGLNHYIACVWYLFAVFREDHEETWVKASVPDDASWVYVYMTAFHWSITQFTPAAMDVQPQNLLERCFAVTVVVLAMIGFSYIVGSITGGMTQLRSMKEDQAKQFWTLRRYLRQHNVNLILSIRVQRHLEHIWKRQKEGFSENTVKLLQFLSEQLRKELRSAIEVPHMQVHPLIERMSEVPKEYKATLQRLANSAVERKALARNDSLFYPREMATHMYFVAMGRLQYIRADEDGVIDTAWVDISKRSKEWISEPVLWVKDWCHIGEVVAATEGDLLCIEPGSFVDVIKLSPSAMALVARYCCSYIEWLNTQLPEKLSDVTCGESVEHTFRGFMESAEDTFERRSMFKQKKGAMLSLAPFAAT